MKHMCMGLFPGSLFCSIDLCVCFCLQYCFDEFNMTYLVAQMVKGLSTMRETQVQSLGREDPLEKEMATHSSTLAWRIPWAEEPGGLQSMGVATSRHN